MTATNTTPDSLQERFDRLVDFRETLEAALKESIAFAKAAEAETRRLRQAIWDACAIMGFDNDGNPTPIALVSDIAELLLSDARSMRQDYDDSLRESEAAEATIAETRKNLNFAMFSSNPQEIHDHVLAACAALNERGGQ